MANELRMKDLENAAKDRLLRSRLPTQLWKTKMCKYIQNDACQYGRRCVFAHTLAELQDAPNLSKTRLCEAFSKTKCTDEDCMFAHGEEELRFTNLFYKKQLCIWHKKGKCRNGERCRFAHGDSELRGARPHPRAHVAAPPRCAQGPTMGRNARREEMIQENFKTRGGTTRDREHKPGQLEPGVPPPPVPVPVEGYSCAEFAKAGQTRKKVSRSASEEDVVVRQLQEIHAKIDGLTQWCEQMKERITTLPGVPLEVRDKVPQVPVSMNSGFASTSSGSSAVCKDLAYFLERPRASLGTFSPSPRSGVASTVASTAPSAVELEDDLAALALQLALVSGDLRVDNRQSLALQSAGHIMAL